MMQSGKERYSESNFLSLNETNDEQKEVVEPLPYSPDNDINCWQSYSIYFNDRRRMIKRITYILKRTEFHDKPMNETNRSKVVTIAQKFELSLYRSASTIEKYNDDTTLPRRVRDMYFKFKELRRGQRQNHDDNGKATNMHQIITTATTTTTTTTTMNRRKKPRQQRYNRHGKQLEQPQQQHQQQQQSYIKTKRQQQQLHEPKGALGSATTASVTLSTPTASTCGTLLSSSVHDDDNILSTSSSSSSSIAVIPGAPTERTRTVASTALVGTAKTVAAAAATTATTATGEGTSSSLSSTTTTTMTTNVTTTTTTVDRRGSNFFKKKGDQWLRIGNYGEAKQCYDKALYLFYHHHDYDLGTKKNANYHEDFAKVLHALGIVHYEYQKYEQARTFCDKALDMYYHRLHGMSGEQYIIPPPPPPTIQLLHMLGTIEKKLGNDEISEEYKAKFMAYHYLQQENKRFCDGEMSESSSNAKLIAHHCLQQQQQQRQQQQRQRRRQQRQQHQQQRQKNGNPPHSSLLGSQWSSSSLPSTLSSTRHHNVERFEI